MTKINLIPKEAIAKEEHPELKILAIAGAAILVFAVGYSYLSKVTRRASIKKEIIIVDNELAKLQKTIDRIAQLKAEKNALNAKKSALEVLVKTRLLYPVLMEDLAKIIPSGMWLLNLNTATGDATTKLTFNAIAYDNYIIADLLQALEDSNIFQSPDIGSITSAKSAKGVDTKQFSINVNYVNQEWK